MVLDGNGRIWQFQPGKNWQLTLGSLGVSLTIVGGIWPKVFYISVMKYIIIIIIITVIITLLFLCCWAKKKVSNVFPCSIMKDPTTFFFCKQHQTKKQNNGRGLPDKFPFWQIIISSNILNMVVQNYLQNLGTARRAGEQPWQLLPMGLLRRKRCPVLEVPSQASLFLCFFS